MEYFTELNNNIKAFLANPINLEYYKDLQEVDKIAKIIIENTMGIQEKTYETLPTVDLNRSIQLADDFFKQGTSKYKDLFYSCLQLNENGKYKVQFNQVDSLKDNKSNVDKNSGIERVDYNNSLDDVFNIVHETTHFYSLQKVSNNITPYFAEVPTITMEFLLADYLKRNGFKEEDISKIIHNRFLDSLKGAAYALASKELLDLYYKNNGELTKDIMNKYVNSCDVTDVNNLVIINYLKIVTDDIVDKKKLYFPFQQRYVIGVVLGANLYYDIKDNTHNMKKLDELINICSHSNYTVREDILKMKEMGFPVDENGFNISNKNINELTKSYIKLYEENNKKCKVNTN
jgi:hypothetical protein